MGEIKNIIFDLGGVLINLDFAKSRQSFADLGFLHFEKMYSQFKVDQLFEKLEKGSISQHDFYTIMLKVGREGLVENDVEIAWNSLLLDFRESSLLFLHELIKTFNLFLLSNTNEIHLAAVNSKLQAQTGHSNLDSYFKKCYYSHLVGMRKPDGEIFEFVLTDAAIKAGETLFIDDTADNIVAAANAGFKTHLLKPGEKIEDLAILKIT